VGALIILSLGRGASAFLVALVGVLAAAELYATLRSRGYRPAAPVGLVGVGALVLVSYDRGLEAWPLVLVLVSVFTLLWYLIRVEDARPLVNFAMTMVPFGYVGILAGFGGLILALPNGVGILLGAAIAAVAHDVFGYAVGARLGTTHVAPSISPNKTLEGLMGGVTAAIMASLIFSRLITPWDGGSALWLGFVVGVSAPIGDLCESMLKRDMGVKDFGNLLPGHGGILDRFDAILFALPGTYYLVRALDLF
jgi:phosphatidate cytidylyltransferase